MTSIDDRPCRRCDRPVRTGFHTFQGMHFVCFHYEFEHRADVDDDCGLAGCPSAPAVRHKDRLVATIHELLDDWSAGPPANWDNHTVPIYLEALAGWLGDCEGYYRNRKVPVPWNSWQVVQDALRAATIYE